MSKIKRTIIIIAIILTAMLIIPLITVNTVKADAGMLVTMMLFFIVHPIVSIVTGILAGKDIKFFWFTPYTRSRSVLGIFVLYLCNRISDRVLNSISFDLHD